MSTVNKIFVDKMGARKAADFIGVEGDIFYDQNSGDLRLSDGKTPGGMRLNDDSTGIYRGFQAGMNTFRNSRDSFVYQVVVHNSGGKVDYINYTQNTNNDDFYVTGLINQENSDQNASIIAVVNFYGTQEALSLNILRNAVKKFIDVVFYDENDNQINNLETAKQRFYDNISVITNATGDNLYAGFAFDDGNRNYWPEYSQVDSKYTANFKLNIRNRGTASGIDQYDNCTQVQFISAGSDYSIGDKLVINGQDLGGVTPTHNFTLVVDTVKSGHITGLNMTNSGTNLHPNTYGRYNDDSYQESFNLSGGSGNGAEIHVTSCDSNGAIQEWEVRNGGGENYQVGDILTLNLGGDDATFEVTAIGTNGIGNWHLEGDAYIGSPARVNNGYWPKMNIDDGDDDQYDTGNFISTSKSTSNFVADIVGNKMTITNWTKEGTESLQPGMYGTFRMPNNFGNGYESTYTFKLVSQATNDTNVWYISESIDPISEANVRIDGLPYGNGNLYGSNAFGDGETGYVTVYDNSVFAMISFGINVDSVYYNGDIGADSNGYKEISTLLGHSNTDFANRSIPQVRTTNNQYYLTAQDAGKHVYNIQGGYDVVIPVENTVNFPVGTAITIVSSDGWCYIYADNSNVTQVWGAGFNTTSQGFYIPNNSIATLLKIAPEKWMLSGAGLAID